MKPFTFARAVLLAAALLLISGCDSFMDPEEPGNLVPETVMENAALPALELNGSRFHLETYGEANKPVIVFLHGGPGSDFRALLRLKDRHDGYALTDDYFLVFWDQRGSGLSQRHNKEQLTIDVYTEDLRQLIAHFSPDQPVLLIGHSWGAMYATQFINTYPERVRGAVLSEPGPLNAEQFERIKSDLYSLDLGAEWLNDWAWSHQFFSPDDHARMDHQRMLGVKQSQPRYHQRMDVDPSPFWRLGAAANRYVQESGMDESGNAVYDFTDNLSAYPTEVLFLASEKNEVIGKDFQEVQRQVYPRSTLQVVPDSGHDLPWTHPAETLALIRTYLGGVEPLIKSGASR